MTEIKRVKIHPETDLADVFPFSRLVRVGNLIEISGTGAYDGDMMIAPGDLFRQTAFIYSKIENALAQAGAGLADIVKITIFMKDAAKWPDVARAHRQYFEKIRPAVTLVEVSCLIAPEMEIEIEASAYIETG